MADVAETFTFGIRFELAGVVGHSVTHGPFIGTSVHDIVHQIGITLHNSRSEWVSAIASIGDSVDLKFLLAELESEYSRARYERDRRQGVASSDRKAQVAPKHDVADLPPLSENAAKVYDLLVGLRTEPLEALTGPRILEALTKQGVFLDNSTLVKRIIPELRAYGVENKPRYGYYLPASKRPVP